MIIDKHNALNTRFFTINDNVYEVRGTKEGFSRKVLDSIDTVRNNTKGTEREILRSELITMINKFKAQKL